METGMETSTLAPKAPRLTAEEENALVSQVLEIIGGITLEALQTLEQPEEREVWSVGEEEGDDSVFYSDEDQTSQDAVVDASRDDGADVSGRLARGEAAELPQREGDPGARASGDKDNLDAEKEACQPESADPGAEDSLTPENLASISGESVQPNSMSADAQTPPEHSTSAETANLQVKEEDVVLEAQTPNLQTFDVTNEESYTRLKEEAEVPKETSSSELQTAGSAQLEVDRELEEGREPCASVGFHQGSGPGYSTLPLPKKPSHGHQKSFDHLASTKYSTVSYRRIRRGNTRQKIEEFEHMMMNL